MSQPPATVNAVRYRVATPNRASDIRSGGGGNTPVACSAASVPTDNTTTTRNPANTAPTLRIHPPPGDG